ncbi:COBRA-like protein 7 [Mangifera indica]|uniref:COBRA-like protein 7 n=1 Tax=Mangifera indica TaxID=29780 RepID=UPI001CF939D0|nr:COBRA-like protein 7 [Mangifera indica]
MSLNFLCIIFFSTISISFNSADAQPVDSPTPSSTCIGIFLSYSYTSGYPIPPINPPNQPYRFESTLTILNNGLDELRSWRVFVGFQHEEVLVSATNAVLADGSSLPAFVGNGTVFSGFPKSDLKSAVETAGDLSQMEVQIRLVGTQFGVGAPNVPMPGNISLANDGYRCLIPTFEGNNQMNVCCIKDPGFKTNITVEDQAGDLVIMYDVIRSYDTNYWAQVSISNYNPLRRLDNWQLSWEWMREEFIYAMKGAYPLVVDTSECIYGPQGRYYQDLDFSTALNCERRPIIIDLPPTRANDTTIGKVPFCCRNGTILPSNVDPSKSTSIFLMQVYKMPPDLNRTELFPPQNWKINGTLNPDYQCESPVQVFPSRFPDSSGLPTESTAIASWKVVCNITQPKQGTVARVTSPRCCVSFSAFFNDSAIPCGTCACGCKNNSSQTCSVTDAALLVRPDILLVPFENRTIETLEWYKTKGFSVPSQLPCGDNCGVSINWHLLSDHSDGWTARITFFNWGETDFPDWFAAVQLDKAVSGLEGVYSINGSVLPGSKNTIFFQGFPGSNYLVAETDGANPKKNPRLPGKQQSVISFTKKTTPNIHVAKGDGFPTKVIFNGEECALPTLLPISGNKENSANTLFHLVTVLAFLLMH